MRRTLAALGLATLAACGGTGHEGLVQTPGTSTSTTATSTTTTRLKPVSTSAAAPRPGTTSSTIAGPVPIRYRIEVHTSDASTLGFADVVDATLHDPRGWQRAGFVFQRADDGSYLILLAEGDEVQQRCRPYDTYGKYSCQLGPMVAITADRWRTATPEWRGDLATYRQMLVNHEVGHLLGLHHRKCPGAGPAPVMSQQSTDRNNCTPNPWPLADEVERAGRHDLPLAPGYEPGDTPDAP